MQLTSHELQGFSQSHQVAFLHCPLTPGHSQVLLCLQCFHHFEYVVELTFEPIVYDVPYLLEQLYNRAVIS